MAGKKNKIVITCSRLDLPGGIEKAVTGLANLLAEKGHIITLLVLDETANSFYPIIPTVTIVQMPLNFGIVKNGNILSRKIKFIKHCRQFGKWLSTHNPDIIISTEFTHTVALSLIYKRKNTFLYSWEHHEYNWLHKSQFWRVLLKRAYKKINGIICLNETEAKFYRPLGKTFVIPNFSDNNSGITAALEKKLVLTIGWLIPRKGTDYLMKAAKAFLHKYPDWKWKVIGEGPMKDELISFIEKENLNHQLILQAPLSYDLSEEYSNASLFVLTSRIEVFGFVLTEAMSYGLPCVSFNCPSGPENIITHLQDGILTEKDNPEKLANAIILLAENENLRKKMGKNALINVKRFSSKNIYTLWDNLLFSRIEK